MYNCTLQQKTPLKAKTPLRAKKTLCSYSTLRCKKSLRDSYAEKFMTGARKKPVKRQKAYNPSVPYFSVFTSDLKRCVISGDTSNIHIHHIFGAANKKNSEKYGFIIPLRADWHNMADYGIHFDKELDLKYKRRCQTYFVEHYGTKEDFIQVFGKWW